MAISAKHALLDQVLAEGLEYVFGNPGSTEVAFMDGLQDYPQLKYILGLHETVAVAMADGFGRALGKPAFANVHIAPGLANAMGMVYNSWKGGSPLVLTAGQQDTRFLATEPLLAGDLVRVARPWVKLAIEINRGDDMPMALRRAFKVAAEPPRGPVFVSLPQDMLDFEVNEPVIPTTHVSWRSRPDLEALDKAATLLAKAERPIILVGDQLSYAGGQQEIGALAELIGAPIYAGSSREWNFPTSHPSYMGGFTSMGGARESLRDCDAVLAMGTGVLFGTIWYEGGSPYPADAPFIHVDFDSWEIGKNYPIAVGIRADPQSTAAELLPAVEKKQSAAQKSAAAARTAQVRTRKQADRDRAQQRTQADWDSNPISTWRLAGELKEVLPADPIFVGIGGTSGRAAMQSLIDLDKPGSFYDGGAALGFPLPGALGVQLAEPDRQVVGLLRDGDGMYSIQGLWTAAHYNIPVKYVVFNNAQYRILKLGMVHYLGESARKSEYIGLDLNDPPLDYAKQAQVWGIPAVRVTDPKDLGPALREMFSKSGPGLVDVVIENSHHGYF